MFFYNLFLFCFFPYAVFFSKLLVGFSWRETHRYRMVGVATELVATSGTHTRATGPAGTGRSPHGLPGLRAPRT